MKSSPELDRLAVPSTGSKEFWGRVLSLSGLSSTFSTDTSCMSSSIYLKNGISTKNKRTFAPSRLNTAGVGRYRRSRKFQRRLETWTPWLILEAQEILSSKVRYKWRIFLFWFKSFTILIRLQSELSLKVVCVYTGRGRSSLRKIMFIVDCHWWTLNYIFCFRCDFWIFVKGNNNIKQHDHLVPSFENSQWCMTCIIVPASQSSSTWNSSGVKCCLQDLKVNLPEILQKLSAWFAPLYGIMEAQNT